MTAEPSKRGWHGNGAGHGGPARGAGHGGPARGCGWGGPARGARIWPATGSGNPGWARLTGSEKAELRQRRADALADRLFQISFHAAHEMTQLNAAILLHAIYSGRPVSRGLIAGADPDADMTRPAG